ncbi:FecCD family ABC transporter permease [Anaerosporobacter faecicola]|uniref:FecCD family ABC transporter permease n=1 Tax=Anaerosporobacter faecicola TaxID=2718714 RepID=UPI00143C2214|nr:iron chelate uptake ABC transporter family permease subunit [Anaerosporobacter faecicola]
MITKEHSFLREGYSKRRRRMVIVTMGLLLLTLILSITMLLYGNTRYSVDTVVHVLLGKDIKGATFAIGSVRLPRMLIGLLVGMAFGMAGNTFQTILRNPLASPDIIGVTSGASVAAVYCILMLKLSGNIVSIVSLVAGIAVAILIYLLSGRGSFSGGRLILVGIGMQAMLSSVISFLLLRANQYDVAGAMRWLSGSLNGAQMKNVPRLVYVVLGIGSILLILTRHLHILELGEEYAIALGLNTNQTRVILIVCSVFLVAFATAVTGPIAFVAFLAGPIAKKLIGAGNPSVIAAALVGASLVLGADLIGQFAFSTRFPVGVITGIVGAPYLIILLISMNKRGVA